MALNDHSASASAALSFQVDANQNRVQLLPAGTFRARDGRPAGVYAWRIDREIAQRVIERFQAAKNPRVIDYEHQTLNSAENGQPAPAAGWFTGMEWVDGVGLFAVGVMWTERAKAMIRSNEYRYISPVFRFDKHTGEVLEIINAALTNVPALDGMLEVAAARSESPLLASGLLTETELQVCRKLGVSEDAYYRTKMEDGAGRRDSYGQHPMLSNAQQAICNSMMLNPDQYVQALSEARTAEWQNSPELRAEFERVETYLAYCRAEDKGLVKSYGRKTLRNHGS
jgi:hypothetical protein